MAGFVVDSKWEELLKLPLQVLSYSRVDDGEDTTLCVTWNLLTQDVLLLHRPSVAEGERAP